MFSYFTSIVRVSEVKKRKIILWLYSRSRQVRTNRKRATCSYYAPFHSDSFTISPLRQLAKTSDIKNKIANPQGRRFYPFSASLGGNRAIQRGLIIILTKGQQATPGPTVLSPPPYRCYGQVLAEARSHPYQ